MKAAFIFILSLSLGIQALAQGSGIISGNIKTSDGGPGSFVNISIDGTSRGSVADQNGNYRINNVPAGVYKIIASFVGLESKEATVDVKAGEKITVNFELKESTRQLEEIVVEANTESYVAKQTSPSLRLTSPLIETPQNIQVVTPEVLKNQQVISMSDGLIRNVSGLTRLEHWGDMYTNITARGSQIQAFRNGFNVVNSYWGPLTEDMSFVDHIEFVKGPAGFMLSSGDPSGLYNVVTKKPTGRNKGEASIIAGSFGLFRTALDLDGKLSNNGRLLYRLNVAGQNKNSFRANEYNDRYAIAPVISYKVDDKTTLTVEYNYQRANMSNVGSFYLFSKDGYAGYPVNSTDLPAGTPGTKINDHSVYVNVQHELNDTWKITGQVAQFLYSQVGHSMWPSFVNADGTYVRNVGIWDAKSKMSMAQLFLNGDVKTGAVTHRILAGFDAASKSYMADWSQSHDLDSLDNPFDPDNRNMGAPVNGYPAFDRTTPLEQRAQASGGLQSQDYMSLYVQDELRFIDDRLRLTLAGRYTDLTQSAWGEPANKAKHFTPRAGLSGSINKNTSVYALYDQAFIPQTGLLTTGKQAVALTGNNMEVGLKRDWFSGWNTTLSVYKIIKRNEIVGDPTNPNSGVFVELGEKVSKGVEFDLRGQIARGLNLIANYAYTDSRVTKVGDVPVVVVGSIVPGYAKHTINSWITYQIQKGALNGLGFSLGSTTLIDRATYWTAAPDPSKEMKDYYKVDAGLFWQKDKVRLTLNVFNALNRKLYSGSYENWMYDRNYEPAPMYSYQYEAPRNVRVGLTYSF